MTPDEIRAALKRHGMVMAVARVSGYSHSHIAMFNNNPDYHLSDRALRDLSEAVQRAHKMLDEKQARIMYRGRVCSKHGDNLRYRSIRRCVHCERERYVKIRREQSDKAQSERAAVL